MYNFVRLFEWLPRKNIMIKTVVLVYYNLAAVIFCKELP